MLRDRENCHCGGIIRPGWSHLQWGELQLDSFCGSKISYFIPSASRLFSHGGNSLISTQKMPMSEGCLLTEAGLPHWKPCELGSCSHLGRLSSAVYQPRHHPSQGPRAYPGVCLSRQDRGSTSLKAKRDSRDKCHWSSEKWAHRPAPLGDVSPGVQGWVALSDTEDSLFTSSFSKLHNLPFLLTALLYKSLSYYSSNNQSLFLTCTFSDLVLKKVKVPRAKTKQIRIFRSVHGASLILQLHTPKLIPFLLPTCTSPEPFWNSHLKPQCQLMTIHTSLVLLLLYLTK